MPFNKGEDLLWNDYEVKLLDQAVRAMESYVSQFPDVRVRHEHLWTHTQVKDTTLTQPPNAHQRAGKNLQEGEKTGGLRLFPSPLGGTADRQEEGRHQDQEGEEAPASSAARLKRLLRAESWSVQAEEEVNAAKSVYENINSELKEELPVLFDKWSPVPVITASQTFQWLLMGSSPLFSRVGCYISVFSSMSNLQNVFFKEMHTVRWFSELCRQTGVLGSLITISLPLVHSRPPECDEGAATAASRQSAGCERPAAVNIPLIWISSASSRIRHKLNYCLSFTFQFWLLEETFADVPQSLENQFFWVSLEL